MTCKTLISKTTKEFVHIMYEFGSIGTSSIPQMYPLSCDIELLKKHYSTIQPEVNWTEMLDTCELVLAEVTVYKS